MLKPEVPARPGRRRSHASLARCVLPLFAVTLLGCEPGTTGDAVTFGVAGPFDRAYGEDMLLGAEIARDEINAAGGIDGRPIEFVVMSDDASPQRAIDVSLELSENPRVVAVVGHVNSGAMAAAAAQYEEAGLPAVGTQTTAPEIGVLGRYIFRVASSDSANAVVLARYSYQRTSEVGLLYDNNAYGRGLFESFRTAFLELGGRLTMPSPYLEDTDDLTPYLDRYARTGTELIFIAGTEDGSGRIIEAARDRGYDFRFIGGDGLEALKDWGEVYEGNIAGLMYHPDASAEATRFAEMYRERTGGTPDSFSALGYDTVHLLARAVRAVGADRRAIRDYLTGVGRPGGSEPFEGVAGTVRFDEHGDPVDKPFYVGVLRDGDIELIEGSL